MSLLEIAYRGMRPFACTNTVRRWAIVFAFIVAAFANDALATLTVNSALPITQRVTVQLIQTALDDTTSPATVFGNATQQAAIEAGIDTIWAQAGIDISFLPGITRYNNTFAYQGNAGGGTRPSGDLNTIFSNAASAGGILNSDPLTLNMIMVNIVPAFSPLSENSSAGYARISGNGINAYVGDNLLGFGNGLDVIASVMAHEIGHNLGLNHPASGQPNLMSPSGTTQQLDTTQINTARASSFARTIPAGITGDYNNNGIVDASDYVVWRRYRNTTSTLPNDPTGGTISTTQYSQWRTHFGQTASGAGSELTTLSSAIPEPSALVLVISAAAIFNLPLRRRS